MHAPWCTGYIFNRAAIPMKCPECPIDLRWWRAKCECEARNFDPTTNCEMTGGKHESKWIHDHTEEGALHLICTKCGFDGT